MADLDVFWHDASLAHDTGRGLFDRATPDPLLAAPEAHPENADRLRNMRSVLERGPLAAHLRWREGRPATRDELALVHEDAYLDAIESACRSGDLAVTGSTPVSAGTWEAAVCSAGSALAAMEAVLGGETAAAFALTRPPGHHAQPDRADGYCFFSNAALAAGAARRSGCARVAVLDWDVHHGNGTQECFYADPSVLTVSLHMRHGSWGPSHPQTGAVDELGRDAGEGTNVNVELPLGTGDAGYAAAMELVVAPVVDAFAPDLLVVAAGQDANQFDPNGRQALTTAGFRMLGAQARALAARHCGGRMVLVQEGGYAPTYSAYCLSATLAGALGIEPGIAEPLAFLPDDPGRGGAEIEAARRALRPYWPVLA